MCLCFRVCVCVGGGVEGSAIPSNFRAGGSADIFSLITGGGQR